MFQLMPGTVCGIAAPRRESEKCKLIMKQKKKQKKKKSQYCIFVAFKKNQAHAAKRCR